jgi:hypothetical protein
MALGTGIFLIALGAILKYAVADRVDGVELGTIGVILMVAGALGVVLSFLWGSMARDRVARRPVDPRYDV